MSVNNLMYQMFKQMMQGYKLGKDGQGLFEHSVKCWLDVNPENPFPEDSEAFEHFFRMKNYYNVWQLGGADKKISMRRMMNAARDLCETKAKNPYKFDRKADEEEKAAYKENALKSQEEAMRALQEAERQKAEHEEEVRQIMNELNQINVDNRNRNESLVSAAEEAKARLQNEKQKQYIFNVVEPENNTEIKEEEQVPKKNWFKRLLRR